MYSCLYVHVPVRLLLVLQHETRWRTLCWETVTLLQPSTVVPVLVRHDVNNLFDFTYPILAPRPKLTAHVLDLH